MNHYLEWQMNVCEALTSRKRFLRARRWSNRQPSDDRWDALTIELERLADLRLGLKHRFSEVRASRTFIYHLRYLQAPTFPTYIAIHYVLLSLTRFIFNNYGSLALHLISINDLYANVIGASTMFSWTPKKNNLGQEMIMKNIGVYYFNRSFHFHYKNGVQNVLQCKECWGKDHWEKMHTGAAWKMCSTVKMWILWK